MPRWVTPAAYRAANAEVAKARQAAGLTQRDVAANLKVPPSVVAKIETGDRRLDALEVAILAEMFGLEPRELLHRMVTAANLL